MIQYQICFYDENDKCYDEMFIFNPKEAYKVIPFIACDDCKVFVKINGKEYQLKASLVRR